MIDIKDVLPFRRLLELTAEKLMDEQAVEVVGFFPEWEVNVQYEKDQRRRYGEKLYRCISAHKSQGDWSPDKALSLWVQIADPKEEWPPWVQPLGGHDAYALDAKVSHRDKRWVSVSGANVWEPGVFGWKEVV